MLSSLLRPKKSRPRVDPNSPFPSLYASPRNTADYTEDDEEDEDTEDEEEDDQDDVREEQQEEEEDDEDNEDGDEDTPLLPIFSAAHLGRSLLPGNTDPA